MSIPRDKYNRISKIWDKLNEVEKELSSISKEDPQDSSYYDEAKMKIAEAYSVLSYPFHD